MRVKKYMHKKFRLPFDKTVKPSLVYLYGLGICHVCHKAVFGPTFVMEHKVGELGWVWGNMRPAHNHCNARKNNHILEELEADGTLEEMRHPSYTRGQQLAIEGTVYEDRGSGTLQAGSPSEGSNPERDHERARLEEVAGNLRNLQPSGDLEGDDNRPLFPLIAGRVAHDGERHSSTRGL